MPVWIQLIAFSSRLLANPCAANAPKEIEKKPLNAARKTNLFFILYSFYESVIISQAVYFTHSFAKMINVNGVNPIILVALFYQLIRIGF